MSKTIHVFANWKMYLDYDESNILANSLALEVKKISAEIKLAVFPSALSFYPVGQVLEDANVAVGAQNLYWVDKGGCTGEISATMYKSVGCRYALVGHSERRHLFKETNEEVRQKLAAIISNEMTPVLCVGETDTERKDNRTEEVVEIQIRSAMSELVIPSGRDFIVAYEPVWAIGTGLACDPLEAERMHALISKLVTSLCKNVKPIILYGGSVRPQNVLDFVIQPSIDGVLVGAASTKLDGLMQIVHSVSEMQNKI